MKIGVFHIPNTLNLGSMMMAKNFIWYTWLFSGENSSFVVPTPKPEEAKARFSAALGDKVSISAVLDTLQRETQQKILKGTLSLKEVQTRLPQEFLERDAFVVLSGDNFTESYSPSGLLWTFTNFRSLRQGQRKGFFSGSGKAEEKVVEAVTIQSQLGRVTKKVLPKGWFARNVAVIAGETAVGQLVAVMASPIITRLYSPNDFGILSVYSSILILGIISTVASWRYEFALALRPYLWLLPIGMGMVGTYNALTSWAIRKGAFSCIARTKLAQGVGSVIVQIPLGALGIGPLGLLIGRIVGQAVGIRTLLTLVYKGKEASKMVHPKRIYCLAVRYRKFPLFSNGAALLNALGLQVPVILLSAFYGSQAIGQFALVQRVFGFPLAFVGTSVSQLYLSRAALEVRTNVRDLRRLFYSVAKYLSILGLIPTLVLIFAGPWLFSVIFGDQWWRAGMYAQIMAFMFFAGFVATPLSYTFSVVERQDLSVIWNAGRLFLSSSSIYLAHRLQWNDVQAIVTHSLAMVAGYAVLLFLSIFAI